MGVCVCDHPPEIGEWGGSEELRRGTKGNNNGKFCTLFV